MISANTIMRHCRDAGEPSQKERAHTYMAECQAEHKPPPEPQEIRERVGWAATATAAVAIAATLASCVPTDTRTVPAVSCTSQYTGQTKEEHYETRQCMARDRKGNCTYDFPVDNVTTRREVRVVCDFKEWQ